MSEETTETTETVESDKEQNFAALRAQLDAANEKIAQLRPFAVKETLRDAGFDPQTDRGKALMLAIEAGKVETDSSKLAEFAKSEFGWEPTPALTPEETVTVSAAAASDQLHQVATPDGPAETIDDQIAAAQKAGDYQTAVILQNRKEAAAAGR